MRPNYRLAAAAAPAPTATATGAGNFAFWTSIGAAWPNRDGEGFSLQYDALPLGGRIGMRRIAARASTAETA